MKKNKIVFIVTMAFLLGTAVELVFIIGMLQPQEEITVQEVTSTGRFHTPIVTQSEAVSEEETTTQSDAIVKVSQDGIPYRKVVTGAYTSLIAVDDGTYTEDTEEIGTLTKTNTVCQYSDEYYYLYAFKVGKLFEDSSIAQIEYLLEDCTGTFNGSLSMDVNKKVDVESTPYIVDADQQQDVYFNVYLDLGRTNQITASHEVTWVNAAVDNARVRVRLIYKDGREETMYLGFKHKKDYNYSSFGIYKLNYK